MAYDAHANFAYGTVLTAPSPASTGTSLVLNSGQGARFPTPPFNVTIWPASTIPDPTNAEIARCTGLTGDTLTITRHTESTSARTVVVGDQVAVAVTAKVLTDIETGSLQVANNLSEVTAATARTNLGLGTAATHPVADFLQTANNLSEVTAATARTNLGLGAVATLAAIDAAHDNTERAFVFGKSGSIGATETDAADFPFCVPYNCTMLRMKVTMKTGPAGAMVVQLRKAAATVTTAPTYSDVSGFSVTFSASNVLAVVDPADANLGEGDFLGFSCSTGSGTNLMVELVVKIR
jgi:hypothetical protein